MTDFSHLNQLSKQSLASPTPSTTTASETTHLGERKIKPAQHYFKNGINHAKTMGQAVINHLDIRPNTSKKLDASTQYQVAKDDLVEAYFSANAPQRAGEKISSNAYNNSEQTIEKLDSLLTSSSANSEIPGEMEWEHDPIPSETDGSFSISSPIPSLSQGSSEKTPLIESELQQPIGSAWPHHLQRAIDENLRAFPEQEIAPLRTALASHLQEQNITALTDTLNQYAKAHPKIAEQEAYSELENSIEHYKNPQFREKIDRMHLLLSQLEKHYKKTTFKQLSPEYLHYLNKEVLDHLNINTLEKKDIDEFFSRLRAGDSNFSQQLHDKLTKHQSPEVDHLSKCELLNNAVNLGQIAKEKSQLGGKSTAIILTSAVITLLSALIPIIMAAIKKSQQALIPEEHSAAGDEEIKEKQDHQTKIIDAKQEEISGAKAALTAQESTLSKQLQTVEEKYKQLEDRALFETFLKPQTDGNLQWESREKIAAHACKTYLQNHTDEYVIQHTISKDGYVCDDKIPSPYLEQQAEKHANERIQTAEKMREDMNQLDDERERIKASLNDLANKTADLEKDVSQLQKDVSQLQHAKETPQQLYSQPRYVTEQKSYNSALIALPVVLATASSIGLGGVGLHHLLRRKKQRVEAQQQIQQLFNHNRSELQPPQPEKQNSLRSI